jgi:iron complex outermembrane recepter protein
MVRVGAPATLTAASLLAMTSPAHANMQEASEPRVVAVSETADEPQLGEIVVTAQKREQPLQDVPISVTAFGDRELIANRIVNIVDLNGLAPNLSIRLAPGGVSLPSITLRGVLSFGAIPGSDKQVGLYFDGVYLNSSAGSVFELADIERIEVLRGPQGTLFGRNSTAGAISIVTREPTGDFALHQELTVGNYDHLRSKTRVNLPALGPLSALVSYVHSERRGDIRNLGAGTSWDYRTAPQSHFGLERSPKWLGNQNVESVSAALKFAPGDHFSAIYRFDWTEDHGSPDGTGLFALFPPAAGPRGGALLAAIIATQPPSANLTPITKRRPDAVNNWFSSESSLKAYGHNLTADLRLNDSLSLRNILAYRYSYVQAAAEVDGFGGLVSTIPPSPGLPVPLGTPFLIVGSITASRSEQWSDEIQVHYNSNLLTLTAGYLHFWGEVSQGSPGGGLPATNAFKFFPNFVISPTGERPSTARSNSDALFAQAEVHLTPQLDVVGGYRHTWDRKVGIAFFPGLPERSLYDRDEPAYTIGLTYQPVRDVLFYGKYTTAFVSGGAFSGVAYDPEYAKSWEAGFKADWLDRRVRTNLSIFTVKYTGLQHIASGITLATSTGRPELAQVGGVLINAGSARAKGFEFEGSVLPLEGLMLNAGVGYTDIDFLSINPLVGRTETYSLPLRSKWTVNLAGQYETRPVLADAHLSFRIDATYRSKYDLSSNDPTPELAALAFSEATWRVNGRIALAGFLLGDKRAELALWGRNLLNDTPITVANSLGFIYSANYEHARTYGVDLIVDF